MRQLLLTTTCLVSLLCGCQIGMWNRATDHAAANSQIRQMGGVDNELGVQTADAEHPGAERDVPAVPEKGQEPSRLRSWFDGEKQPKRIPLPRTDVSDQTT